MMQLRKVLAVAGVGGVAGWSVARVDPWASLIAVWVCRRGLDLEWVGCALGQSRRRGSNCWSAGLLSGNDLHRDFGAEGGVDS